MTPEEFAKKIRERYPGAYDKIDDIELSRKVVQKHPVYRGQVNFADPEKIERLRGEAEIAVEEAERVSGFGGIAKETVKEAGRELFSPVERYTCCS